MNKKHLHKLVTKHRETYNCDRIRGIRLLLDVKGVPYTLWSRIIELSCPDIAVREQLLAEYQTPVLGDLDCEQIVDESYPKLHGNGLVRHSRDPPPHPGDLDLYSRGGVPMNGDLPQNYRVGYRVKPYISGFFKPDGTASLWGATSGIGFMYYKLPYITDKVDFSVMYFRRWHRLFSNGMILPRTGGGPRQIPDSVYEYRDAVTNGKFDRDRDIYHTRSLKVKRGLKGPLLKEVTDYWRLKLWIENESSRKHNRVRWRRTAGL